MNKQSNTYFQRDVDAFLLAWKNDENRKPLLLRGARQVGKSSAVRHLGKKFDNMLELNFERDPELFQLFNSSLNPHDICAKLSAIYKTPIVPGKTLVFLDEIQSCKPAIASLRFFYEEYPALHLIAAGSLLEFALEEIPSFGVGRIRSIYMYPFSFNEFLLAQGYDGLVLEKRTANESKPLLDIIHNQLTNELRNFILVGGMPECVRIWVSNRDYLKCRQAQTELLDTYIDDFAKYKKRISPHLLQQTFRLVALQCGSKFVFSQVSPDLESTKVRDALDLLSMAGIIIPVTHSSGNGLPLGAEQNLKFRKYIFLDTGLMLRILNLEMDSVLLSSDIDLVNKGAIAEVLAGLEILKYGNCNNRQELYYWQRIEKGAQAEVDFLISKANDIVPVEVKAGTKGSMQSLYRFMDTKQSALGIRTSLENFSKIDKVEIYPLYAIENFLKN